ncbi:Hypothetical predicted protein [Cloeon dipterum]|uniref:Uncharacterized protein n=1 Tax=Cloeon dipterum TaxID=197152 RepID=A0A8S1E1C5_9INSE|nr:Hypothetical predicted protein [Cloeon dipterum]
MKATTLLLTAIPFKTNILNILPCKRHCEEWKAHVVSGDMKRAKDVAKEFAAEYGPVEMTDEPYSVGTVVPQQQGSAVLLNVVSKERFYHKFSYDPETLLARL